MNNKAIKETAIGKLVAHYVDSDGKTLSPDQKVEVKFERIQNKHNPKGVVTWSDWQALEKPEFELISPQVSNVTPNKKTIKGTIKPAENGVITVTYK